MAWAFWYHAGLTLSHYDAKAHLVVARRVFDNLTPGWQQIGAVWLPLPHLINLLPTQIDFFYRTGLFASAISIACLGVSAWAATGIAQRATGSTAAALTSVALLALNPNLLYLHATPMTEPLLLAVSFLLVLWLDEWLDAPAASSRIPGKLDAVLLAAAWTRYEAWLVLATALALTALVLWRKGLPLFLVASRTLRLARWPAIAVLVFVLNSPETVGSWFVSSGFFVPDPTYEGLVARSALAVWWGTHQLSGYVIEIVAIAAALWVARRQRPLVALALLSTAVLPFYAFVDGHPFRIRYMIPTVAAAALFSGLAVGFLQRRWPVAGAALAILLVGSSIVESPPWAGSKAPLIAESQWDLPFSIERRAVTRCLAAAYNGEKILASMGSLAHYMQELSAEGFTIADFINEGNGTIWAVAMGTGAAPHAGWMLVEERAEGGDVLAQRLRTDPAFANGMTRMCEGGGVALYRRDGDPGLVEGER